MKRYIALLVMLWTAGVVAQPIIDTTVFTSGWLRNSTNAASGRANLGVSEWTTNPTSPSFVSYTNLVEQGGTNLQLTVAGDIYLSGNQIVGTVVNTYADLESIPAGGTNKSVYVRGRSTVSDGGEGWFYASSPVATNLGTVSTSATPSYVWRRAYNGPVNARWFMSSSNLQAAVTSITNTFGTTDQTTVYFPPGVYNLDGNVYLSRNYTLKFDLGATIYGSATFIHKGKIDAGPTHIFSTNLTVELTPQEIDTVYFEWWGASALNPPRSDTTDSAAAVEKAFQSFRASVYPSGGSGYPGQQLGVNYKPLGIYGLSTRVFIPSQSFQIQGKGPTLDGTGFKWVGSTTSTNNLTNSMLHINAGQHWKIYGMSFIGPQISDTNYALGAMVKYDDISYGAPIYNYGVQGRITELDHCLFNDQSGEFLMSALTADYNCIGGFHITGDNSGGNFDFGKISNTPFIKCMAGVINGLGQSVNWRYENILFDRCKYGIWQKTSSYYSVRGAYLNRIKTAFMFGTSTTATPWYRADYDYIGGENLKYPYDGEETSLFRLIGTPSISARLNVKQLEVEVADATEPGSFYGITNNWALLVNDQPNAKLNLHFSDCNFKSSNWVVFNWAGSSYGYDAKPTITFENCYGMGNVYYNLTNTTLYQPATRLDNCEQYNQIATLDAKMKPFSYVWDYTSSDLDANKWVCLGTKTNNTAINAESIRLGRFPFGHRTALQSATYKITTPGTNYWMTLDGVLPTNSLILSVSARLITSNPLGSASTLNRVDVGLTNQPTRFGTIYGNAGLGGDTWRAQATNAPLYIGYSPTAAESAIQLRGRFDVAGTPTFSKTDTITVTASSSAFTSGMVNRTRVHFLSGALAGTSFLITNYTSVTQVEIDSSDATTCSGESAEMLIQFAASKTMEVNITSLKMMDGFNSGYSSTYVPAWSGVTGGD